MASTSDLEFKDIPIDNIQVDSVLLHDPEKSKIDELAKSIITSGLILPIRVIEYEPNKYFLVDGYMRVKACKQLGYKTIYAIVEKAKKLDRVDILVRRFKANYHRYENDPVKTVILIKTLKEEFKLKVSDIAGRLNMSERHVKRILSLTNNDIELIRKGMSLRGVLELKKQVKEEVEKTYQESIQEEEVDEEVKELKRKEQIKHSLRRAYKCTVCEATVTKQDARILVLCSEDYKTFIKLLKEYAEK